MCSHVHTWNGTYANIVNKFLSTVNTIVQPYDSLISIAFTRIKGDPSLHKGNNNSFNNDDDNNKAALMVANGDTLIVVLKKSSIDGKQYLDYL
jgi:hypothetical protein